MEGGWWKGLHVSERGRKEGRLDPRKLKKKVGRRRRIGSEGEGGREGGRRKLGSLEEEKKDEEKRRWRGGDGFSSSFPACCLSSFLKSD